MSCSWNHPVWGLSRLASSTYQYTLLLRVVSWLDSTFICLFFLDNIPQYDHIMVSLPIHLVKDIFFPFCLCRVFVATHGILVTSWVIFHCSAQTPELRCTGSVVVVHRLSNCDIQTQHVGWVAAVGVLGFSGCMVCWILAPWPGIEPVSLALLGGFLTRWTNQGSPRTSWLVPSFSSYEYLLLLSSSVMSNCLRPHGLQHTRPSCPLPSPKVYSNSWPSSLWCPLTISSSGVPLSSCLKSFPASVSFPASQFFASGGQSIAGSASASVLPMNIQGWFPLGWTALISWKSKGLSRVLWI